MSNAQVCWLCGEFPLLPTKCSNLLSYCQKSVTGFVDKLGIKSGDGGTAGIVCSVCMHMVTKIDEVFFQLESYKYSLKQRVEKGLNLEGTRVIETRRLLRISYELITAKTLVKMYCVH